MDFDEKTLLDKYGKLEPIAARKYVPLMSDFFMHAYIDPSNHEKFFFVKHFFRCAYNKGQYYYGKEAPLLGDLIIELEEKEQGTIDKIFKQMYLLGEQLLELARKISKTNWGGSSEQQLLEMFKEFAAMYTQYSSSLMGFYMERPIEQRIKHFLKGRSDPNEDLAILTFPIKENFAAIEQTQLHKISDLLKTHSINSFEEVTLPILEKIQEHITQFGWINTRGGNAPEWSSKEIFLRAMQIKESAAEHEGHLKSHQEQNQQRANVILDEINATPEQREWVRLAKELVYYRTYRTDYLNKTFCLVRPLLEEIARRRGLTHKELLHLRIFEIQENRKIEKQEIERRMINYFMIASEPGNIIFSSDPKEIIHLLKKYCEQLESVPENIKGRCAFKGKATGKVRLVVDKEDMIKVEKGDVLVAPMTTPDIVMAMEKASAFVTDEGGITCHAAIVAREMKKPCIVGTGNATRILKDGDIIEVDAINGIVRKIT